MKKILLIVLASLLTVTLNAQWKVTSFDKTDSQYYKLLQIVDLEESTLVYATLRNTKDSELYLRIRRDAGVFVNGSKYKLLNSVNLPVYDEAEQKYLIVGPGENQNFIMEFEKFPLQDGFDLLENDKKSDDSCVNFYGIHFEKIDTTAIINTDRFLNAYLTTIYGTYSEGGKGYPYYLRDGIFIGVNADNRDDGKLFGPGDLMFNVEIINDSDHGVMIDMNKIWITGHKKKKDGSVDEFAISKYSPESYEQFLASQDYEAAKRATSGNLDRADYLLRRESNNSNNSEWGKLGFSILSSMTEQMISNNVNEYLKNHPKERLSAMKTTSLKSGKSINGFVACSKKKADYYVIHVKFDDYEFTFSFN